jgi:hypothetical protein
MGDKPVGAGNEPAPLHILIAHGSILPAKYLPASIPYGRGKGKPGNLRKLVGNVQGKVLKFFGVFAIMKIISRA